MTAEKPAPDYGEEAITGDRVVRIERQARWRPAHLFAAIEGRRLALFGPTRIGHSAQHVCLPPIR